LQKDVSAGGDSPFHDYAKRFIEVAESDFKVAEVLLNSKMYPQAVPNPVGTRESSQGYSTRAEPDNAEGR